MSACLSLNLKVFKTKLKLAWKSLPWSHLCIKMNLSCRNDSQRSWGVTFLLKNVSINLCCDAGSCSTPTSADSIKREHDKLSRSIWTVWSLVWTGFKAAQYAAPPMLVCDSVTPITEHGCSIYLFVKLTPHIQSFWSDTHSRTLTKQLLFICHPESLISLCWCKGNTNGKKQANWHVWVWTCTRLIFLSLTFALVCPFIYFWTHLSEQQVNVYIRLRALLYSGRKKVKERIKRFNISIDYGKIANGALKCQRDHLFTIIMCALVNHCLHKCSKDIN